MTAYNVIADSDIDPESPITTTLMTRMRDNAIAISEGTSPAPAIQTAALEQTGGSEAVTAACIRDGAIDTQAKIGASVVGSGQLKTTSGTVSQAETPANITLPGGAYGFYPQSYNSSSSGISTHINEGSTGSYVTNIFFDATAGRTGFARQYYVQSSPPYDLGDGEIPLFIFAQVDKTGKVVGVYEAPEAPWHNNGPTNSHADFYRNGKGWQLRKDSAEIDMAMVAAGHASGLTKASAKALSTLAYQDYHSAFNEAKNILIEITQAIKNKDMDLIPSPMKSTDNSAVVMLDPVSDLTASLFNMKQHGEFSINELLHDGDLIITDEVVRAGPSGVPVHEYKWR